MHHYRSIFHVSFIFISYLTERSSRLGACAISFLKKKYAFQFINIHLDVHPLRKIRPPHLSMRDAFRKSSGGGWIPAARLAKCCEKPFYYASERINVIALRDLAFRRIQPRRATTEKSLFAMHNVTRFPGKVRTLCALPQCHDLDIGNTRARFTEDVSPFADRWLFEKPARAPQLCCAVHTRDNCHLGSRHARRAPSRYEGLGPEDTVVSRYARRAAIVNAFFRSASSRYRQVSKEEKGGTRPLKKYKNLEQIHFANKLHCEL